MNALETAEKNNIEKIPPVKIQLFGDKMKTSTSAEMKSKLYEDEAMVLRSLYFTRDLNEIQKVEVFSHEWLSYPPSLFQPDVESFFGYSMRKANKAVFFHSTKACLKENWTELKVLLPEPEQKTAYIIDMMAFIQRHQFKNCTTFKELFGKYADVIIGSKPVECDLNVLVGDRYESNVNCIKEMERMRRSKYTVMSHEFEVQDNIKIPNSKLFLANNNNKARLLKYISEKFYTDHSSLPTNVSVMTTGMAEDSASTTISSMKQSKIVTDLHFSNHSEADSRIFAIVQYLSNLNYKKVIIQATDTDIFVMALYYATRINLNELWIHRFDVYIPIHCIIQKLSTTQNISKITLGNFFLCTYVLSGCDTVSFSFRKGKTYVFKTCLKYANDPKLQSILNFPLDNSFDTAEFENLHLHDISLKSYMVDRFSLVIWTICEPIYFTLVNRIFEICHQLKTHFTSTFLELPTK